MRRQRSIALLVFYRKPNIFARLFPFTGKRRIPQVGRQSNLLAAQPDSADLPPINRSSFTEMIKANVVRKVQKDIPWQPLVNNQLLRLCCQEEPQSSNIYPVADISIGHISIFRRSSYSSRPSLPSQKNRFCDKIDPLNNYRSKIQTFAQFNLQ